MQGQHRLLAAEDDVGVLQQFFPVQLHRAHFLAQHHRCPGQAGGRVALLQVAPALGKVVARIPQQLERRGLAGRRFGGVLGDALGQHPQLAGVADVLLVVGGLGVQVREVGEQQHDEHDQCDEQHDDLRATAGAFQGLAGFGFGHRSGLWRAGDPAFRSPGRMQRSGSMDGTRAARAGRGTANAGQAGPGEAHAATSRNAGERARAKGLKTCQSCSLRNCPCR